MKNAILAVTLMMASAPALAQNLTKAEEGKVQVAQCYSACMEHYRDLGIAEFEWWDRFWRLLISEDFNLQTPEDAQDLFDLKQLELCVVQQGITRTLDACQGGCRDLEAVYGAQTSLAKNRYTRIIRDTRANSEGLWKEWHNSPSADSAEFARQCDLWWGGDGSAESAAQHAIQMMGRQR